MANRLDAVTIGIEHKGPVIVGMVLRPKSRPAVIAPARRKRRCVKRIDRCAARRAKTEMRAGDRGHHAGFARDGEFDTERAWCCSVVRATSVAKVDDAHEPKRAQGQIVKPPAA